MLTGNLEFDQERPDGVLDMLSGTVCGDAHRFSDVAVGNKRGRKAQSNSFFLSGRQLRFYELCEILVSKVAHGNRNVCQRLKMGNVVFQECPVQFNKRAERILPPLSEA